MNEAFDDSEKQQLDFKSVIRYRAYWRFPYDLFNEWTHAKPT